MRVVDLSLIEAHDQRFRSALADIMAGDGLPNVTVIDARQTGAPGDGYARTVKVAA